MIGADGSNFFDQAPVAIESGEAALNDPASGQQHEAFGEVGALDDRDARPEPGQAAQPGWPHSSLEGCAAADCRRTRGRHDS